MKTGLLCHCFVGLLAFALRVFESTATADTLDYHRASSQVIKHVDEGGERHHDNLRTARHLGCGSGSNNSESHDSFGGGMSEGVDDGNNNDNFGEDHVYNEANISSHNESGLNEYEGNWTHPGRWRWRYRYGRNSLNESSMHTGESDNDCNSTSGSRQQGSGDSKESQQPDQKQHGGGKSSSNNAGGTKDQSDASTLGSSSRSNSTHVKTVAVQSAAVGSASSSSKTILHGSTYRVACLTISTVWAAIL